MIKDLLGKVTDAWERHRERHRTSGFGFALADSINYLNPAHWDTIAGEASIFLSRGYLQALEYAGPKDITPRYAIIYRDEQPVAILVAQLIAISAGKIVKHDPAEKERDDALEKRESKREHLLSKLKARVLVCGNLLSWGWHGCAVAASINSAEIWPAVTEALYRIRRSERLTGQTHLIMLKDFCLEQQIGETALQRFSYRPLETEPNMVLDLPESWQSYEDYLASLTANYRKAVRKTFKNIEAAGCRVEHLTDLTPHANRLHNLYLQVHNNAAVRPVTIPAEFFPALASALGDRFRCTVIRREEQILGFVTAIKDQRETIGYYIGFDRAESEQIPLYLRLLHSLIEDAIDWRAKRLSLGRTALEPKARLGCRPEPLKIWVRHRHPAINLVVRHLLPMVPHDDAPERNPFK